MSSKQSKIVLGFIGVIAVVVLGYLLGTFQTAHAPTPESNANATGTTTKSSEPTFKFDTPVLINQKAYTHIDTASLVTTSNYPTITGTANVPEVGIIIYDDANRGLVGTSHIPVKNGKWTYSISVFLPKGGYKVVVIGGVQATVGTLTVR